MKKLLSLLVVCSLILSAFAFISVNAAIEDEIPLALNYDLNEDFSGSTYDARIQPYFNVAGTATGDASSGELKILFNENAAGARAGSYIYAKADKTGVTGGEYVTQLKLKRPATLPIVYVYVYDSSSRPIFNYTWGNSATYGRMRYSTSKGVDGSKDIKKNQADTKSEMVLTVKYDLSTMQFSIWFDSTKVVDGGWPRNKGAQNLSAINVYTDGSAGDEIAIDDIKFYAKATGEQVVKADFDAITFDSVFAPSVLSDNILKKDVKLPTIGAYGSPITWTSSNEKYINNKGHVTFADTFEPANPGATLTATVGSGEQSMTKSFDLKVAKENQVYSHIPMFKEMHYKNDFSIHVFTDSRFQLTEDGGSITIADNALKLTRTENIGTTLADIYVNEDKSALTGNIYASFVLRKEGTGSAICNIQSASNKDYLRIIWNSEGRVSVTCKKTTTISTTTNYHYDQYENGGCYIVGDELRFDILLKTQNKKFDLWLNGIKWLSDRAAIETSGICSLTNFRFYLEKTDFITATVDDIKVYSEAEATDGIFISEDNKTAQYIYFSDIPEDCKNTAMIIGVYDNRNELVDINIGYLEGNVATASISELKSGQTVRYMAFKDMEDIVPLTTSIEKVIE